MGLGVSCGKLTHPFIPSPHFREDMFLEGNHKRLKFLKQAIRNVIQQEATYSIKAAQNRELD